MGIKSVSLTAFTRSKKAVVKYKFLKPDTTDLAGYQEGVFQNNNGKHSSTITLLANMPTNIRVWVEAEDGSRNESRGQFDLSSYNQISVKWDYVKRRYVKDYRNTAYDEIIVEGEASNYDTLFILFAPPKADLGYTIKDDNLPAWQSSFEKMKRKGGADEITGNLQWYKTSVDKDELKKEERKDKRVVVMPLIKTIAGIPIDCFEYKLKIKM